jgi:membrane associated rhomboid family serine protease
MPLIPIGTEFRTRRAPVANWVLIGLNVLVFLFTDYVGGAVGAQLKVYCALDAARPTMAQYVTYQFLHGDIWHLLGNMLFLWIFGHPVCDRMGNIGYTLFYLAGGIFAGVAFTLSADNPIVGASGAIAAVTTAFLVLFPRVHITLLWWFFLVFTFQVPALILIVFKMVLWDTILAPGIERSSAASNVAYSAHLGGYAFGFVVALGLLTLRALPRNQFDLIALWDRWRRRTGLVGAGSGGPLVARPITVEELGSHPLETVPLTPVEQLREEIAAHIAARDLASATAAYMRLLALDPRQVLARPQQLEIANYLAQAREYRLAAQAYESYLTAYPGSADVAQVHLFLGLIYSRYMQDYDRAIAHLRQAEEMLPAGTQRALAEEERRTAEERARNGAC